MRLRLTAAFPSHGPADLPKERGQRGDVRRYAPHLILGQHFGPCGVIRILEPTGVTQLGIRWNKQYFPWFLGYYRLSNFRKRTCSTIDDKELKEFDYFASDTYVVF